MKLAKLLKNKRIVLILFLIVLLGFILRLYHLASPSLSYDEIDTAVRSKLPFAARLERLSQSTFPPFYFMLMWFWVRVFGYGEFALRLPSLIFSVLSIIVIYKLGRELFNKKVGLISAFLLSIWLCSINYAQDARPYAMFWFFGMLSFLYFYKFLNDNKTSNLLLYVIATILSIYTHYLGFIFIITQNIIFFLFFTKKQGKKWLLGQLAIILLYLPWLNNFLFSLIANRGILGFSEQKNLIQFFKTLFFHVISIGKGRKNWAGLFLYCFLIIPAVIRFENIKKKKDIFDFSKSACVLFAWILIPIILFCLIDRYFMPILAMRYLGFIHIPIIILLSKAINKYNVKAKSAILIFLCLSILSCRLHPYYKYDLKIPRDNWRDLFKQLSQRVGKNDLVVYWNIILKDYYGKKIEADAIDWWKLPQLETDKLNYDSIFIVYKLRSLPPGYNYNNLKQLKGYILVEHFKIRRIGFSYFKKIH